MSLNLLTVAAVASLATASPPTNSPPTPSPELARLEAALKAVGHPVAVHIEGRCHPVGTSLAFGMADADKGVAMTADTPARVASNTKTFTAATVLRLWEDGWLDLEAPIKGLITPELDRLLSEGGYDTGRITVRHLLNHSGGLYDHGSDPRFSQTLFAEPDRRWTRESLIRLSLSYGGPQGEPGVMFRYSDLGYILLGDIIERVTGQTLAAAVREQLKLDSLGLTSTWWEVFEAPPTTAPARGRQFIGNQEATRIHASMDLYGGGGLVMSARDLARFMAALFEGKIFAREATLQEMIRSAPHQGGDVYLMGLMAYDQGHTPAWFHSGFWGTLAYYLPERGYSVSDIVLNKDGYARLNQAVQQMMASPDQPGCTNPG